jgi:hypothetical protein
MIECLRESFADIVLNFMVSGNANNVVSGFGL